MSSGPACSGAITLTSRPLSFDAPRATASRSASVLSDGACATMSSRFTRRVVLRGDPEGVGLVEADVAAGIPGVIAFLGHVADLRSDHDRLQDAVQRADRKDLLGIDLEDARPRAPSRRVVGRGLPAPELVEQDAGIVHVALLALLALALDEHAPARPLQATLHGRAEFLRRGVDRG